MGRAMMVMMLMTVVTWNLQRVSFREQKRCRLRRVASFGYGAFWGGDLDGGELKHRTALVHGRKAGVLLRGTALLKWIEKGQQK